MALTGYTVEIVQCSTELTHKERVKIKDTTDAIKLDEVTQGQEVIINPAMFAVLAIHNEKSENGDYNVYVVVDEGGTKYTTGSESFWTSFMNIYEEMRDETGEEWAVKVYRVPSKNYKGKDFITCSIQ
jgi:hypothetical protein